MAGLMIRFTPCSLWPKAFPPTLLRHSVACQERQRIDLMQDALLEEILENIVKQWGVCKWAYYVFNGYLVKHQLPKKKLDSQAVIAPANCNASNELQLQSLTYTMAQAIRVPQDLLSAYPANLHPFVKTVRSLCRLHSVKTSLLQG